MYEMEGPRSVSLHRRAQLPKQPRGRAFATSVHRRSRAAIVAGCPAFSLPIKSAFRRLPMWSRVQ
jgi:hypothetical protein